MSDVLADVGPGGEYLCPACGHDTLTESAMRTHQKRMHEGEEFPAPVLVATEPDLAFVCLVPGCDFGAEEKPVLAEHVRSHPECCNECRTRHLSEDAAEKHRATCPAYLLAHAEVPVETEPSLDRAARSFSGSMRIDFRSAGTLDLVWQDATLVDFFRVIGWLEAWMDTEIHPDPEDRS